MKLEQRYIVFKLSDIRKLDDARANMLKDLAEAVVQVRQDAGKPPLQAVVIEHDWPEYEPTVALLAARVDGTPAPAPVKVGQLPLEVGMQTEKVLALMQYIREALTTGDIKQGFAQGLMRRLEELAVTEASPDANVERNRQMLLDRSKVGLEKYGVTTERGDLTLSQWVQHAIEEVLDLANYLQATKSNLEKQEKDVAIREVGAYGLAYDAPGKKRAYTYQHQPGNEIARTLGCALIEAHSPPCGDIIDYGLNLLEKLGKVGFGVYQLEK